MVDVCTRRCSQGSCTTIPTFNFVGSKTAVYCRQHSEAGMVNVHKTKRCSHDSCSRRAAWGVLTDAVAKVCYRHKSDIVGRPVFNLRAECKIKGCRKLSRWGLDGKQPTHCPDHGPLRDDLVCTAVTPRLKLSFSSPSYLAGRGPSLEVKSECFF